VENPTETLASERFFCVLLLLLLLLLPAWLMSSPFFQICWVFV